MIETILLLLGIGLASGTVGAMFGIGGGIFTGPVLAILGFSPIQVASTSLISVTFTSASSTIAYSKQKRIEYKIAVKLAAFSMPGAVIGAFISSTISLQYFKALFAIVLVFSALQIAYKGYNYKLENGEGKEGEKISRKRQILLFYIGSFFAGVVSSIFGIGGGIIFVPLMIFVFHISMMKAAPTSQLTLLITSLAGTASHLFLGHFYYVYASILSIGSIIGAQIGVRLFLKSRENLLQRLYALLLLGIAGKLIFDAIYPTYFANQ